MRAFVFNSRFLWPLVIVTGFIVYGSLYPFHFQADIDGQPLARLLATWRFRPEHFGNLIGNIFLYMPLGLFGVLCLREHMAALLRLVLVLAIAAALSFSVELTQAYLPGRVSTLGDLYPNILGAGLGALAGLTAVSRLRWPFVAALRARPAPTLLIGAFLAYRLFPYVPSLDLHEYWQSVKPIFLYPELTLGPVMRYAVLWLVVATLAQAILGVRSTRALLLPAMLSLLGAQVVITRNQVTAPEIAACALVVPAWLALSCASSRTQTMTVLSALAMFVVATRLYPFYCTSEAQPFGWIPFQSFLHGSMAINTQSFLEKFFLYGSLVWLLAQAGGRLAGAAGAIALVLLATSVIQTCMASRSAEITDAVMVLVIAGLFAMIDRHGFRTPARSAPG